MALLLSSTSQAAYAACSMVSTTITCAPGPVTNDFVSNIDGVTFNVQSGAALGVDPAFPTDALTLSGNGITLTNQGTIDPLAGGLSSSAEGGAVLGNNTLGGNAIIVDNKSGGVINGLANSASTSFGGQALVVQNARGGTTSITNSGTIGMSVLDAGTADDSVAVIVYGGGNIQFTNSGTITGRVVFGASGIGGNSFVNAGTVNGSVYLGDTAAFNTFTAVSGSSVTSNGNAAETSVAGVGEVAAAGTVDAGIGTATALVLQNSTTGPGSGTGGAVTTISASTYLHFEHLEINSGTWNLQGAVASHDATINDGLVNFDNAGAFGNSTLTVNGGAIAASVANLNLANAISLSSGTRLTLAGTNPFELSGMITGGGGLTINDTGVVKLSGANLFAGGVNLNAGGIILGNAGALGSGTLTVGGNASLNSTGASFNVANNIVLNAGSTLTLAGNNALALNGSLSGIGNLTKNGAGTLTLGGASSFAGTFDIAAGTVAMGGVGSLSQSIALKLSGPGAGLDMSAADQTMGSLAGAAGTSVTLGSKTLTVGGLGTDTAMNGTIGGAGKLIKTGGGILTLGGANTYGGGTTIQAGTIKLGSGGFIGPGALDTTNAGTFDLGGHSQIVATLDGLTGSFVTNSAAGASSLLVSGSGTFGGIIQNGAGTVALTKSDSGTLTLNGVNTYTGLTTVSGGTLIVGGDGHSSAAIAGNVLVGNGGTLGGHGSVGSTIVNSGGTLAPGASIGTLTVNGDLSIGDGATLDFEFGAPGANFSTPGQSDSVDVTGNLSIGSSTLKVTDTGDMGPGLYNLFTWGGTLTITGGGFAPPAGASIQILTVDKKINLINTAGLTLNFWNADGLANSTQLGGGSGTWSRTSPVWTNANGSVTAPMAPQPGFAIFGGAAGMVNVDNSDGAVAATGMQFAADGYRLTGDPLSLVADADHPAPVEIRVGDGSAGSAAWTATIDNVLAGTDGLKKTGAGTLVLNGANIYSGGTTLAAGVLSVSSDANLGDAAGGLTLNGGTLRVTGTADTGTTRAVTLTGDGVIDIADAGNQFLLNQVVGGAGSLTKEGAGTLRLGGANSYAGATTIAAGTLALTGTGSIAASSSLTIDGGAFDLTGLAGDASVNNLSGSGGALKLGAGTLTVGQSLDGSFAGTLSGAGGFTKSGSAKLTYDGDGSAFTGLTTVAGGTLVVGSTAGSTAKLGGSLTVGDTATLMGYGKIGSGTGSTVTVASGGTVSPGGSIGTLTIDGNYVQQAGSTYFAEIAPDGTSDLISVTGTATIEGGTVYASKATGSYTPGTNYKILTAAKGVSGAYDTLDQNTPFVDLKLTYDPTSVYIRAVRNNVDFCAVAGSANQCAVADAVQGLGDGNVLFDAVAGVPSADAARSAFDQLSGGIHASGRSVLIETSQLIGDIIDARLRSAFGAVAAASAPVIAYGEEGTDNRATAAIDAALAPADTLAPAAWGNAFGDWGHLDGGVSSSTGGFLTGIDAALGRGWRAGVVAGYSHTSFDADMSSGNSQNWHLGLYGGGQWGALGLRAGAAYTWHDISTARSVDFPGFSDHLSADYNAGTAQAFGELAYDLKAGSVGLEPFANLAYINLHSDGFAEKGGAAALTSPSSTTDATFTTLGLRASTDFSLGSMTATARGTLGWRHAYDAKAEAVFTIDGSDPFVITAPIARDAALVEAGLDLALSPNATLGLDYRGQLASGASQNGFNARLDVRF
ncbi:autotransporter domain-containing protein [Mesorhizobium sp. BH1-1-5]|uniref:autotransporter domain-containing protein n=1 Tax=Mesorhizobium sp. BH1-1-5 TaxID=2876661 RepID=UPI001CCD9111|nr:autotransporter domain-containing protein [Mesorhizobium sp. BH1-1-5]